MKSHKVRYGEDKMYASLITTSPKRKGPKDPQANQNSN